MPTTVNKNTVNSDRLLRRIMTLGEVGAIEGTTGCARLALTDEDKAGLASAKRAVRLEIVPKRCDTRRSG